MLLYSATLKRRRVEWLNFNPSFEVIFRPVRAGLRRSARSGGENKCRQGVLPLRTALHLAAIKQN
jgi:hypothetical protein